MPQTIKPLSTEAMKIAVNCYLVQSGSAFFLIDTGLAKKQNNLTRDLERAGCQPGNLKLIILTHGDPDHSGNCAHLRERFGAKIAMHRGDLMNSWQYFRKPAGPGKTDEIFTDNESKIEKHRRFLFTTLIFMSIYMMFFVVFATN